MVLSADWDATLFWRDEESRNKIDESTLPISDDLKRHLDDYYGHWSELFLSDDKGLVSSLEKRLLDDTGLEIWKQLRLELAGQYRVMFWSAEFGEYFEAPEELVAARKAA